MAETNVVGSQATWQPSGFARGLSAIVLAAGIACGSDGSGAGDAAGNDGGDGEGFDLDYQAGPAALLDLNVNARLRFSGVQPMLPTLSAVGVAQAQAIVFGDGQQWIDLRFSSTEDLDVGDRFSVHLEFSRANDGHVLDGGGTLTMGCSFDWSHADDTLVSFGGDCDVRRSEGGYEVTIVAASDGQTEISGSSTFAPVPNQPVAYTPGDGCSESEVCLSLDPDEYEPETGYCMPNTRLKSHAAPCTAECAEQLRIEVGGEEICICTSACGRLDGGGGGDPPTCDPAYGCIDF